MDQTEKKLQIVRSLVTAFPGSASADGDGVLRAFLVAVDAYTPADVGEGVRRLIAGEIAEHDGKYCPTPPQLARAARKALDDRLDAEHRANPIRSLPPADIVHSPAERARVAAMADVLVRRNAEQLRTEDAEKDRRMRELTARTNARFMPDMSPVAMKRRLGFAVGDPEGDSDAA